MNLENGRDYSGEETGFIAPPDAKPINPETREINAHFHEKSFSGPVKKILADIKTEEYQTGRWATSVVANNATGIVDAMFEKIKWMRELNNNQAS